MARSQQSKLTNNQKLEILLSYADNNIKIFPCKGLRYKGKEKQPLTENGFKDATIDKRRIKGWNNQWPHAWWAMPTDQFLVIDQDVKKDGNGIEETKALEDKWGKLPKTRIHRTPSGGRHIFLQSIEGMRNSVGKISPNIDIRAEGGYVCIPPSEGYTVEVAVAWENVAKSSGKWSTGIHEFQKKKVTDIHTGEPFDKRHQRLIPEGQRNAYLVSIAGSLHNVVGMTEEAIYEALKELRDNACAPSSAPENDVTDKELENMAYREAFLNSEAYEVLPEAGEFEIEPKHLNGLYTRRFQPLLWLVQGLIPEGLGITASRPKMGKSRLWWSIAYAVATGEKALGQFEVSQGKVLYIAIDESSERLIRDRCKTMGFKGTDNLFYEVRDIPRIDENFLGYLHQWKEIEPDLTLVIIDTMAHIKPEKKAHQDAYDFETKVWAGLQQFCHANHMHVNLIHHLRKTHTEEHVIDVLGSTAVTAKVDIVATIKQDKQERGAVLNLTGRETPTMALNLMMQSESGVWEYMGEDSTGKNRVSSQGTLDVWDVLRDGPLSVSQIAGELGKNVDTMRRKLVRMEKDGEVKSVKQGRINLYYMGSFQS